MTKPTTNPKTTTEKTDAISVRTWQMLLEDETATLLCPHCGGSWLHHEQVETFYRPVEDAKEAKHVSISRHAVSVKDSTNERNPSRRRDGMVIWFDCETCHAKPFLLLWQHKGETFLELGYNAGADTGEPIP